MVKLFKMGVLLVVVEEGWGWEIFQTGGALCGFSKRFFRFSGDDLFVDIDKVAG